MLLATVAVAQTVNFREMTPLAKSFSGFPLQVGEWDGKRQEMEQKSLNTLKLSDYTMIDYGNPAGREINFYVAYNQSQSKREATHSPGLACRAAAASSTSLAKRRCRVETAQCR